ncbi:MULTISPECIES: glucose-1-phosphate adenylyltransferase [Exiguobacterium]|jgi:glucose-1-phosphate adenylyltransferase|uniref:glucose-1-phosphate adenylyltransferase n=1 Tax=Exiguobacterium TaxID=33986 RepID=UPI0004984F1A|nr:MULTISPECIES: glucose-1-phosphate adenylyltransferase [Exiguobacterium]TCI68886.1 glucose-1-phosphate adenylyltransferase [Exiguobacterium sp. IPCI3]TCI78383.1 glucose-1-phosphate adenylyltransferase [Exiguobacterium sp. IPCH1]TCI79640.1 glucose-1-phosphate adenylyltransferase [Exiguobacterium sp. IPBC4]
MKQEMVAMLLAGGEGKRLGPLTRKTAKPAVNFGGKYRIIDFPLSNCTNSGITTVGVLTQYEPLELNRYLGIGSAWDLDRRNGGLAILPPYQAQSGKNWYEGTANAIYRNLSYIDDYDPEYVLILSGDHIYKMDYEKMLDFHKEKQADVTISVMEVPWDEAPRFGILNTSDDLRINEFDEKPEKPKSNLASMGIYIFNWKVLREHLIQDAEDETSSFDFGKNIIPNTLLDGLDVFAYKFKGYWKDVGTIQSLWEANMDLLEEDPPFDLYDPNWKIYSVNPNQTPQFIGKDACVEQSVINEGCQIEGEVQHSVLFYDVRVGEGSLVKDSVIMPGARIGKDVTIHRAIVASCAVIQDGATVGEPGGEIVVIEPHENIESGTVFKQRV